MPIVIIAGTGDRIVDFARHSERLHATLPQSELVAVAGAGHMVHHTVPEQIIAGIDRAAGCPADNRNLQRADRALGAAERLTVD
jgi:pimeloyl-ACP methyl ester carboxylesterase